MQPTFTRELLHKYNKGLRSAAKLRAAPCIRTHALEIHSPLEACSCWPGHAVSAGSMPPPLLSCARQRHQPLHHPVRPAGRTKDMDGFGGDTASSVARGRHRAGHTVVMMPRVRAISCLGTPYPNQENLGRVLFHVQNLCKFSALGWDKRCWPGKDRKVGRQKKNSESLPCFCLLSLETKTHQANLEILLRTKL